MRLLLFALAIVPGAARAQDPVAQRAETLAQGAAPFWSYADGRLLNVSSGIGFPLHARGMDVSRIDVSSHKGTGLDDILEYRASNGGLISVFVFRPTLPDAGLTAAMTDVVIHDGFGRDLKRTGYDLPGGGIPDAVHVMQYEGGVLNGRPSWTSAAFVRVGPWLVAARITGPVDSAAELEGALKDLFAHVDYGAKYTPNAFHRVGIRSCGSPAATGTAQQVEMQGILATAFATLIASTDSNVVAPAAPGKVPVSLQMTRVPDKFCGSLINTPKGQHFVLLIADGSPNGGLALTETAGILLLNDAGGMIEITRASGGKTPWYVIRHDVGEGRILAALDAPPGIAQYEGMLSGTFPPTDKNAVSYTVDADGKIGVHMPSGAGAGGKTASVAP